MTKPLTFDAETEAYIREEGLKYLIRKHLREMRADTWRHLVQHGRARVPLTVPTPMNAIDEQNISAVTTPVIDYTVDGRGPVFGRCGDVETVVQV